MQSDTNKEIKTRIVVECDMSADMRDQLRRTGLSLEKRGNAYSVLIGRTLIPLNKTKVTIEDA